MPEKKTFTDPTGEGKPIELETFKVATSHSDYEQRKAKRAAADKDTNTSIVWTEVEEKFKTELEPHFQIEEKFIGKALETHGELELATRLYAEHKALRACVAPGSGRSSEDLKRFGLLLEKHIRFEERELFEVAQKRLSPEALKAVSEACHARGSGESPRQTST